MEERYSIVCKKIIEHYSQYLTKKEILALKKILKINNYDNLNIIIFINKLIDRVWHLTLTNPKNFKQGNKFTFLTTRDLIPITFNAKDLDILKEKKTHELSLITQDNILEHSNIISGVIVDIDFTNQFIEPILPIDFEERKTLYLKSKLNVCGVYNISLGMKDYDVVEEEANNFAKVNYLPNINILKTLYNFQQNQIILDEIDKDSVVETLIEYYLITNNYDQKPDVYKIKKNLEKTYKKLLISKYLEYYNNVIKLEDLINFTFELIENDEYLQTFDKKM